AVSRRYPPRVDGFPTCSSPVRHGRPPKRLPFDLHALGTPPALFLSQDQTLHQDFPITGMFYLVCTSSSPERLAPLDMNGIAGVHIRCTNYASVVKVLAAKQNPPGWRAATRFGACASGYVMPAPSALAWLIRQPRFGRVQSLISIFELCFPVKAGAPIPTDQATVSSRSAFGQ